MPQKENDLNSARIFKDKILPMITTRSMSTLYSQKISQIPEKSSELKVLESIQKHFSPSTQGWNNSVYAFNTKRTILRMFTTLLPIAFIASEVGTAILTMLHPYCTTGFADGESSFSVVIRKNRLCKTGWRVDVSFSIGLHEKDRLFLESIRSYFGGVGNITKQGKNSIQYRVTSIKDLKVIIGHFDKYPLITQKHADFVLFKQVVALMDRKEHLTNEGLHKIVAIRASMNNGLSDELKAAFASIIPVTRPLVHNQEIPDPNWLVGFVAAEGCFFVKTSKSKTHKLGESVQLIFQLAQHTRDSQLINSLVNYFSCGLYKTSFTQGSMSIYTVTKFTDLTLKIIPFFDRYPLPGNKALEFADFKGVVELMKNKGHLSVEGLAQISKIKTGMNRGRQLSTWARPQLAEVRKDSKSILQRGIHTAPTVKSNSSAKKDNYNNKLVSIVKNFSTGTREWANSVYMFNTKNTIWLSAIDKIVIKLIKSYFNAYFLSNNIRKFSVLNKIYLSKLEVKHTNSKVVILVYIYADKVKRLQLLYKNLRDNSSISFVNLLGRYLNKKVELRVIIVRDIHLDANILAERLANDLNKKYQNPLKVLRKNFKISQNTYNQYTTILYKE